MDDVPTLEPFSAAVGEPFDVRADGALALQLVLVEARRLGETNEGREAFALLFRGPVEPVMQQATYRLSNDRLGERDIFIVPVGRTAEGTDYEAIFS
jgi:hypothetical protein